MALAPAAMVALRVSFTAAALLAAAAHAAPTPAAALLLPCDIYAAATPPTPCVAAHSTVRALFAAYSGPLYQVRRASDNATLDVTVHAAGGFAAVEVQEDFCFATRCVFWKIYDQSGKANHLTIGPPGGADPRWDTPADAAADPIKAGGHNVYGLRMDPPSGYRCDNTTDIAVGDEAETMYAVFNGSHFNDACCFDCEKSQSQSRRPGRTLRRLVAPRSGHVRDHRWERVLINCRLLAVCASASASA